MEERNHIGTSHKITINQRQSGSFTGVENVVSFEPKQIVLDTVQGRMDIKGEELKVSRLTIEKGEVDIRGHIQSLVYTEIETPGKKAEKFLGKLFR